MRTVSYHRLHLLLCRLFFFFLFVEALQEGGTPSFPTPKFGEDPKLQTKIQVCQDENCCQRFNSCIDLVQTIRHLSDKPIDVEPMGSERCERGPNVKMIDKSKDGSSIVATTVRHAIDTPETAAIFLEMELGISVHPNY
jgi:hypothetical protein